MRRPFLLSTVLLLMLLAALAVWQFGGGGKAGTQLAAYRIGQAVSYREAAREIAALERRPDREHALRELAGSWGTGNQQFDFYLARRATDPQASDTLRQALSLELSWRPELLPRWAHYWSWRVKPSPDEEIASLAEYLDALAGAHPARRLTWREVLNLQAVFCLTDQTELARRLAPDNWLSRYRSWKVRGGKKVNARRPSAPLPDWRGAPPKRA